MERIYNKTFRDYMLELLNNAVGQDARVNAPNPACRTLEEAVKARICQDEGHAFYEELQTAWSMVETAELYGLQYTVVGDNLITYKCPRCGSGVKL